MSPRSCAVRDSPSRIRQCPGDYKDGKLAELWRGPPRRREEGWGFESLPERPPSALIPVAVQLRLVAGARRAIARRIHGVRLAITAMARSNRRIVVRGPGVWR